MSIAVDGQFLSLYYKSKGFDATTLGFLYSLTPLTTFLTVPIWSMLTAAGDEKNGGDSNSKSNSNTKSIRRSFKILYLSVLLATASQICLAILDKPKYMTIIIIIAGICQSPVKPMLDGIIMDNLSDRSEIGKVRFFCILVTGFGTNLGGRLLSLVTRDPNEDTNDKNNFNLLFLARVILTIPPILLIRELQVIGSSRIENDDVISSNHTKRETISDKGGQPSSIKEDPIPMHSIARSVVHYCCKDTAHLLFFACIYVAGSSGGVSDAFSYPRYQESGCSTAHIGQSRLLSSVAGAMMFWYSGRFSKILGTHNLLVLCMTCTASRFLLLKRMDHPSYVYLIDLFRASTYGIFWSSSTIYASQIGPPSLRPTMLLILNGIYNGIGRSTGAILAGKFQALFGVNNLFLWCSRLNYALAMAMAIISYRNYKRGLDHADYTREAKKAK